ncbi:MAG: universal stress protein [Planctomycetota bacterium]
MKPILLALSTFRQSERAVDLAIERAKEGRRLVVVYVADVNLARYLIGMDIPPEVKEKCEEELLKEHRREGEKKVELIARRAREQGVEATTRVDIGRFALKVLDAARENPPEVIVTTRSKRPKWVKRLFGSPVDYLIQHAGCPVVEA